MKIFFLLCMISVYTCSAVAQDYEPLELAKKIFSKEGLPNIKAYVTGEYEGEPSGDQIPMELRRSFLLLQQTENYAVVVMTLKDSAGQGLDTYLHFEKERTWKMSAFRALAMTGFIDAAKKQLESMSEADIEKEIKKAAGSNPERAMFRSREEYEYELGNARLTLDFDDNIISHFQKNIKEFERIRDLLLAGVKESGGQESFPDDLIASLKPGFRKLFISTIRGNAEIVNFLIGGMIDNTVGYFYVSDKKHLPEMNANRYIMIREIGGGWYLYKTT